MHSLPVAADRGGIDALLESTSHDLAHASSLLTRSAMDSLESAFPSDLDHDGAACSQQPLVVATKEQKSDRG